MRNAAGFPFRLVIDRAIARLVIAVVVLLVSLGAVAAQVRPVVPAQGPKPTGPYTPGILAGDYLYVSSQGPRKPGGEIPATIEGQVDQCIANVRSIVEAAELTLDHVVYVQVYLDDMSLYEAMNRAYAKHFTKFPPARAVVGVYKRSNGMHVTMKAVAVRDLGNKKEAVGVSGYPLAEGVSAGVLTHDQLYVSAMLGRDPTGALPSDAAKQVGFALDNVERVLKAAGLDMRHMVFVNPYLLQTIPYGDMNKIYAGRFEFGNTPARATIFVTSLPHGALIEYTGIAVRDLSKRLAVRPKNMKPSPTASPCVFAGDIYYCSAKSGFIPGVNGGIWTGNVQNQLRQTMRNQLDNLEEAGMDFSHAVAATLYFDDPADYDKLNEVYRLYFSELFPARGVVQQLAPVERKSRSNGRWPGLEQMSLIGLKSKN